jgi:hypothetical protein
VQSFGARIDEKDEDMFGGYTLQIADPENGDDQHYCSFGRSIILFKMVI